MVLPESRAVQSIPDNANPVVIVMAKAPRAGHAKTRLCPPLLPSQAASLAACLFQDTVTRAITLCPSVLVAYTPDDGREEMETIVPSGVLWMRQCGQDLGTRMTLAIRSAGQQGFSPLVMIGTDSPTLPSTLIVTAIERLANNEADVVFVPVDDGGFSLIGVQRFVPGLFDGVAWSTATALTDTLHNAIALNLLPMQLEPWYDIDTPEDLARLYRELNCSQTAGDYAPRTYALMKEYENFSNYPYAE